MRKLNHVERSHIQNVFTRCLFAAFSNIETLSSAVFFLVSAFWITFSNGYLLCFHCLLYSCFSTGIDSFLLKVYLFLITLFYETKFL